MSVIPIGIDQSTDPNPAPQPGHEISLPAVLLVNDQLSQLISYEAVLASLPVRCVRALSGEEALTQLLRQPFAAVILDVSMPGMNGIETARLIRTHERFQKLPILFVTGVYHTELDRLKGYQVGAIDYLMIPIAPEILRSKIAILVDLYQQRRELEELIRALVSARSYLPPSEAKVTGADPPAQTTGSRHLDAEQCQELLGMVGHDLRTAVAPIYYLIQVLLRETAPTNAIRPVLQMILDYTSRISRLADDFDVERSK